MKPTGKTYLLKCEIDKEDAINENGIFVLNNINRYEDGFWKAVVIGYGTKVDLSKDKDILPIGTKVVIDCRDKTGMKLVIRESVLYVKPIENILGVIEDV